MQSKATLSSDFPQVRKSGLSKQNKRILYLLREAGGAWVPLPQILALGIAQYSSRILELRRLGFKIENRMERVRGARRSWYRLVDASSSKASEILRSSASDSEKRERLTRLPLFDPTVQP